MRCKVVAALESSAIALVGGEERETNGPQAIEGAAAGGPQSRLSLRMMLKKTIHKAKIIQVYFERGSEADQLFTPKGAANQNPDKFYAARVVAINLQSAGMGRLYTQRHKQIANQWLVGNHRQRHRLMKKASFSSFNTHPIKFDQVSGSQEPARPVRGSELE